MAKPTIKNISNFDPVNAKAVTFLYAGDSSVKTQLTIYKASDIATPVKTITTDYSNIFRIIIPASTLTAGIKYCAELTCINLDGTSSSVSDKTYFWCLATPSLVFDNLTNGQTISSTMFLTPVTLSSEADEEGNYQSIAEYTFYLYDASFDLIYKSSTAYSQPIQYTYKNFENRTSYYLRCVGLTDKNLTVDTGYVNIFVNYVNPSSYSLMYTSVNTKTGLVNYSTNFSVIEPEEDTDDYTISNGYIDLSQQKLTYNLNLKDNFVIGFKVKNFDSTVFSCSNSDLTFNIFRLDLGDNKFRFKLIVPNGTNTSLMMYSDECVYADDINYIVYVKRINNVYQISAIREDELVDGDGEVVSNDIS